MGLPGWPNSGLRPSAPRSSVLCRSAGHSCPPGLAPRTGAGAAQRHRLSAHHRGGGRAGCGGGPHTIAATTSTQPRAPACHWPYAAPCSQSAHQSDAAGCAVLLSPCRCAATRCASTRGRTPTSARPTGRRWTTPSTASCARQGWPSVCGMEQGAPSVPGKHRCQCMRQPVERRLRTRVAKRPQRGTCARRPRRPAVLPAGRQAHGCRPARAG